MPKLIANAEQTILQTAREQLFAHGYKRLTLRKVAAGCGIAVGTIYNYYTGKEMLVANIMLQDWAEVISAMQSGCAGASTIEAGVGSVYSAIARFAQTYRGVWQEYGSGATPPEFAGSHSMLRAQIAEPLAALITRLDSADDAALTPLLAEMVLVAAIRPDIEYKQLSTMVERIFTRRDL